MNDLTDEERANVKKAIAFLRVRCGGGGNLAKALRVDKRTLYHPATPAVVFRLARLAGVGVDDVLTGKYPAEGVCPHCGH